ncbi:MAG: DUF2179 domain-containing protein [Cyclobacteriaceae bacterium]|nr:DUF2179 domain-containing protein [Cyclobacteriaceae bacterium SS2]
MTPLEEAFNLDPFVFKFIVLPILIFMARIMDVSINTVRIIFMLHSKKLLSTVLGFFEALIWLLAISQIFQNLSSWPTYIAYAGGFASGILVGMLIEEKLAIGRVVVRVITRQPAEELIKYFEKNSYRYSSVDAISDEGEVNILFTVIKREDLKSTVQEIKRFNPKAFYTVEGVKKVSDDDISDEKGFGFRKNLMKRVF